MVCEERARWEQGQGQGHRLGSSHQRGHCGLVSAVAVETEMPCVLGGLPMLTSGTTDYSQPRVNSGDCSPSSVLVVLAPAFGFFSHTRDYMLQIKRNDTINSNKNREASTGSL